MSYFRELTKEIYYDNHIIFLATEEGKTLLQKTIDSDSQNYLDLIDTYEPQETGAYCGLASLCTIFNFIDSGKKFKQQQIFEEVVLGKKIIKTKKHMRYGLNLDAISQIIILTQKQVGKNLVETTLVRSDENLDNETRKNQFIENFKQHLEENLTNDKFIIANYWRSYKNHAGGHISPVVAFCKEDNKILILDVAQFRIEPHFIDIDVFCLSMLREDSSSNKSRGYLLLKRVS